MLPAYTDSKSAKAKLTPLRAALTNFDTPPSLPRNSPQNWPAAWQRCLTGSLRGQGCSWGALAAVGFGISCIVLVSALLATWLLVRL